MVIFLKYSLDPIRYVNETVFSNNLYSKINKYYKSLKNMGECYGRNWF